MIRKILLTVLGACLLPLPGAAAPPDSFTIKLPGNLLSENVAVQYLLTGDFGGYGGFVPSEPGRHEYSIETAYEGKPARTFKAIVYAKGCQIVLLDVPSLAETRSAQVECTPLPEAEFEVLANIPNDWRDHPLRLDISYLAHWSHSFFGILDGPVVSFDIAKVSVTGEGAFRIRLPSFAQDPATKRYKANVKLDFTLRQADTGNILTDYECHGAGCKLGDSSTDRRLILMLK